MKRLTAAAIGFGLTLAVLGCNSIPWIRDNGNNNRDVDPAFTKREPQAQDLVAVMNMNARKVQGIQSAKVALDVKQGNETPVGIDGMLACQKPRSFRLKGKAASADVADLGSNDNEFWFWVAPPGSGKPPVYHCDYKDMATGKVPLPFPFNPDVVLCALNIADYNPNAQYRVQSNQQVIELIEATKSLQGQDITKVTVFNRGEVTATRPRVLAYVLKDKQGKDICSAQILETQTNRETGAVLPVRVKIVFNGEKAADRVEMTMKLYDIQPTAAPLPQERTAALFSRRDLSHLDSYDLARGADKPSASSMSIQRTSGRD
jgi:hypothetical protein